MGYVQSRVCVRTSVLVGSFAGGMALSSEYFAISGIKLHEGKWIQQQINQKELMSQEMYVVLLYTVLSLSSNTT